MELLGGKVPFIWFRPLQSVVVVLVHLLVDTFVCSDWHKINKRSVWEQILHVSIEPARMHHD